MRVRIRMSEPVPPEAYERFATIFGHVTLRDGVLIIDVETSHLSMDGASLLKRWPHTLQLLEPEQGGTP